MVSGEEAEASEKKAPLSLNFGSELGEVQHVDTWFGVRVFLQLPSGEPKCGQEVPIGFELYFQDDVPGERPAPAGVLEIESSKNLIRKERGVCEARVRVTKCSMDMENQEVLLRAFALSPLSIEEAWSRPMKVMRHRLTAVDDTDWTEIWYKDVGGKENVISVPVALVDANDDIVVDRPMRLSVSVVYADSLRPVPDQRLLKIVGSDADDGKVDLADGRATLKLRIEEVSKNHQNKAFRIKISPDVKRSPTDFDVSSALTKSVHVRSKINRKRRPEDHNDETTQNKKSTPTTQQQQRTKKNTNNASTRNIASIATVPQQQATQKSTETTRSAEKKDLSPPKKFSKSSRFAALDRVKELAATGESERCREALAGLADWTKRALEALSDIEWQHLGNEPDDNGLPDLSRPHYLMRNPNTKLESLLSNFDQTILPHAHQRKRHLLSDDRKQQRKGREDLRLDDDDDMDDDMDDDDDDDAPSRPSLQQRKSIGEVLKAMGKSEVQELDLDPPKAFFPEDLVAGVPLRPAVSYQISGNYISPVVSTSQNTSRRHHLGEDLAEQSIKVVIAKRFTPKRPEAQSPGFPAFDIAGLPGLRRAEATRRLLSRRELRRLNAHRLPQGRRPDHRTRRHRLVRFLLLKVMFCAGKARRSPTITRSRPRATAFSI